MKRTLLIAAALLVFFFLVLVAATQNWFDLYFDHEINPIDLATLGVNIFIAFFLQYYFGARMSDDRAEKDILIDDLRDLLSTMRQCRDSVMACHDAGKMTKASARNILSLLRKLANGVVDVDVALEMSQCSCYKKECKEIQDALFNYKGATTGGTFPTKPYDRHAYTYQEQTYRILSQKLHSLVFRVNQHR